MKTLILLIVAITTLTSCNLMDSLSNDHEKSNPCQIVSAELVPQLVKDSLAFRYPGVVPIKWLNKDNVGFCVNFIGLDKKDIIAVFSNAGNFIAQEENVNVEQTGQHTDNQPDDSGCQCEVEGKE